MQDPTVKVLFKSADLTRWACRSPLALLISHISYSHSYNLLLSYLVSHIWGGSLREGLSSPPPSPAKFRFKLWCHTYLLYNTYLLYLLYLQYLLYILTYRIYSYALLTYYTILTILTYDTYYTYLLIGLITYLSSYAILTYYTILTHYTYYTYNTYYTYLLIGFARMPHLLTILTILTIPTYLSDLYHMLVCKHKCLALELCLMLPGVM